MHLRTLHYYCLLGLVVLFMSCERYIDITPKGQLIPTSTEDFRMLLDNVQHMNFTGMIGDLASDDMAINNAQFQSITEAFERNSYTWNKNIYLPEDQAYDWNKPYSRIYTANIILEGLPLTQTGSQQDRNTIEGEALFHRAMAHYEVVSLYAKSYNAATADTDLGVPVRLASDVIDVSPRATVAATYAQIFSDLDRALTLLPNRPAIRTRASKVAVYAARARIYLDMGDYGKSLENALAALEIQPELIDYNTIDPMDWPTFPELNSETIFFAMVPFMGYTFIWQFPVNSDLYDSYSEEDLRKSLYFDVNSAPDGSSFINYSNTYGGSWNRFTGLATDELYLIAAETYARTGSYANACNYLNTLLENRYVPEAFTPFQSSDETEILHRVLSERRKELIGRNRRWFDLKRLRDDPRFAVTLERTVLGTTYQLAPNDPRYVYPIPQSVINASGVEQNER